MRLTELRFGVVLPMYNEAENVKPLLEQLDGVRKANDLRMTVLAVEDGSRDDTLAVLIEAQKAYPFLEVVRHPQNRGMAAALRTGIAAGVAHDPPLDVLAFMDADLTHDPWDLPRFAAPIVENQADFVLGSRYVRGGGMRGVPFLRQAISIVGNLVGRVLLRVPASDLTSGFRVVRTDVYRAITLTEQGFGIQLEATVAAHRAGFRIREVPVILGVRKHGYSKMVYNRAFWLGYARLLARLASSRVHERRGVASSGVC